MSRLSKAKNRAKASQTFTPVDEELSEPVKANKTPKAKAKSGLKAEPARKLTATQKARIEAGQKQKKPAMTPAERQAKRRAELCPVLLELTIDEKAQIIKAADLNNRTIKDEITARLFDNKNPEQSQ